MEIESKPVLQEKNSDHTWKTFEIALLFVDKNSFTRSTSCFLFSKAALEPFYMCGCIRENGP